MTDDFIGRFIRKKKMPEVKTLAAQAQVSMNWKGAYDLVSGAIEVGSTERETPSVIWHEFMHKELFEKESLEAGYSWDNIAYKLERYLFNTGGDPAFVWTQPPKGARTTEHKHKTLAEKGLEREDNIEYGLGITTYKSGEVKDYKTESKKIVKTVAHELKALNILKIDPVIGYCKGSKEPSAAVKFKGMTRETESVIQAFKKKYDQDAVMLMNYSGKGWTAIEITGVFEQDIDKSGFEAFAYYFEKGKILVYNEKPDIASIRKKVRENGGTMRTFPLEVNFK
jgi:hypothetical protein